MLDVIGFAGGPAERAVALAVVRAFGGSVKAAGREWIDRGTLDREQVRELLTEMLVALVDEVFPRVLPPVHAGSRQGDDSRSARRLH